MKTYNNENYMKANLLAAIKNDPAIILELLVEMIFFINHFLLSKSQIEKNNNNNKMYVNFEVYRTFLTYGKQKFTELSSTIRTMWLYCKHMYLTHKSFYKNMNNTFE